MAEALIRRPTMFLPVWAIFQAFPLALFTTALVTDIAYVNTAQMQWSNFSSWAIMGGLVMGGFAIAAATLCLVLRWRIVVWRRALIFGVGSVLAWLAAFLNALIHTRDAWTSVMPMGLGLSIVTVVLVLITSWIGFSDASNRVVVVQ